MRKVAAILGVLIGAALVFVFAGGVQTVQGWMDAQSAAVSARTSLTSAQ